MSNRPSLSIARQSIEHLIALHEIYSDGSMRTICANAKHGCVVLAWLERREELMRALDNLERQRPDLVDLLTAFPGSQIVDVRDTYSNGGDHVGEADELEHVRGFYVPGGMVDGGET
jgi:hypothetical protein